MGNAGGALTKRASWFASVFRRDNQSNSIINAELLDSGGNAYNYTAAVANPQSRLDVSPRFDFQLGANNTLTVRYMFDRQTETNSGVSQFALQSQGYNMSQPRKTRIQLSDTQILSDNIVNETRFQYMRDRDNQVAQNSDPDCHGAGSLHRRRQQRGHSPRQSGPLRVAELHHGSQGHARPQFRRPPALHARFQLLDLRIQRQLHLLFAQRLRGQARPRSTT